MPVLYLLPLRSLIPTGRNRRVAVGAVLHPQCRPLGALLPVVVVVVAAAVLLLPLLLVVVVALQLLLQVVGPDRVPVGHTVRTKHAGY